MLHSMFTTRGRLNYRIRTHIGSVQCLCLVRTLWIITLVGLICVHEPEFEHLCLKL